MTPAEVATKLRALNDWRRGGDIEYPGPLAVDEAIDAAVEMIDRLEAAEKERESWKGLAQQFGNELDTVRVELETERMRLVACGVVALANTPDSAKQAREMRPEYWSASCGDVARMVDENIKLRAMIQVALIVLDEVCGNINPERGYADELEADVKRAIAAISLYNVKGE
jgi:hypothetical protein